MSEPINLLAAAGAPEFVTVDPKALALAAIGWFEQATGRTLSPSQVETYLAEMAAYMLSIRAVEENRAIANCFIAWAAGEYLDAHGADRSMPRLDAQHAVATVRLVRDLAANGAVLVPQGTRFAAGNVMLRTTVAVILNAVTATVDIPVEATISGPSSNGAIAGMLRSVDPIIGLGSAELLTPTAGGTEAETDDRYRARLATAFERINRGGSRAAYRSIVMEWSASVIDAAIVCPNAGHIDIYPLMVAGNPTVAEADALLEYVTDGRVPMGDVVSVVNPVPHAFTFVLTLLVSNLAATAAAEAAVTDILRAWRQQLGGYIAPSDLVLAARAAIGVVDAAVDIPLTLVAENAFRDGSFTVSVTLQ